MRTVLVQLPPGLDISKAQDLKNGSFQIGKHTYDLVPSRAQVEVALLTKNGEGYSPSDAPAQLMELTRRITLPKIDKSVVQPRKMIPQRQNLKARHFASGYASTGAEAVVEKTASTSAKRSKPEASSAAPETPVKKQKKEKKEKTPKSEKKKKSKSEKKHKD